MSNLFMTSRRIDDVVTLDLYGDVFMGQGDALLQRKLYIHYDIPREVSMP